MIPLVLAAMMIVALLAYRIGRTDGRLERDEFHAERQLKRLIRELKKEQP